MKKPVEEGWMTVLCVRFQVGSHCGGGQGSPLSAQVGRGGEKPPASPLQCATTAIVSSLGHGFSERMSTQEGCPRQVAFTYAGNEGSSEAEGANAGHAPVGAPKEAKEMASMVPGGTQESVTAAPYAGVWKAQKGLEGTPG
jgi:hypothetical protein